jgi:succinyl-CoA synthetase alpha subunit
MSILIDKNTKVVVQGITGRDGAFHTRQMLDYGTKIVAGVTPGKSGEKVEGVPVFNSVKEAVESTGANTSVIYVPSKFAVDAIYEAADAGVDLVVCVSEGIPAMDMLQVYNYLKTTKTRLVGPNTPGLITPGVTKVGIMPGQIHMKGNVGVVSRSGTLTYEVVYHLTLNGIGQSTCLGIGGDQIVGTGFLDVLDLFEKDPQTKAVVLIGEIGGTDEEEAALFVKKNMTKPVVAFVAGRTAPPGKRMGHAGAIIAGGSGTAAEKIAAFEKAKIKVAESPAEVATLVKAELEKTKVKAKKKPKKKAPEKKVEKKRSQPSKKKAKKRTR